MCGIIGVITYDQAFPYGYLGILKLLNRGYDSIGCATLHQTTEGNHLTVHKYASDEKVMADVKIIKHQHEHTGQIFIAHSRWATNGKKTDANAHPHQSMCNKFALVHNGIIENYEELKHSLENNGYTFRSETDSEVIVNLISYYYKKLSDVILSIKSALAQLEGTYSLIILCTDTPNLMYVSRHGSPCLIGFNDNNNFTMVTSEVYGFDKKINRYIIVKNHDIITLTKTKENIIMQSIDENVYTNKNFTLAIEEHTCAPYKHWTIKEICEQPMSCMRAMNMGGRIKNDDEVILGGFDEYSTKLLESENLILLGCGTSYNSGLLVSYLFKDISGFNTVQVFDGAEFTESDIPKKGKTCFVFLSQSGETKDLHLCVELLKKLRKNGKELIMTGVVNVVDSMIARDVDCGTYLNCGREFAVASTKSFSSQIVVLTLIALWFSQNRNLCSDERKETIKKLLRLQNDITTVIETNKDKCKEIAKHLATYQSSFVLGKGTYEAVAKEGSLKLKEIGYIHTESYSSSALKHGPYALLEDGFPVFLLCPNDKHLSKNQMTFSELKTRGAFVVGISDKELSGFDKFIKLPTKGYTEILSTVALQLIAYYLSIEKGNNCDFPKNLCKTCSVE
jgi:glucosamine--fructose-6-phosphate aminotransferase (isomerizing)